MNATINRDIVWHQGQVMIADRIALSHQQPVTIWFTGLSGSGKSTLAFGLEKRLAVQGVVCVVLDGDNIRQGLNSDLGFSPKDRTENIRRVAEVARLMNDAGLIVITSFISPYLEDREMARHIVGTDRFIEVYLDTCLAVCEERDPKGMYRKARAGELPGFTGVSSPYESPDNADVTLNTADSAINDCLNMLEAVLRDRCAVVSNV